MIQVQSKKFKVRKFPLIRISTKGISSEGGSLPGRLSINDSVKTKSG